MTELQRRALDALRSGRYRKQHGFLRMGGLGKQMCVGGVLCDVSSLGTWHLNDYVVGRSRCRKFMPLAVAAAFGLSPSQATEITKMNDGHQVPERTLAQIADHLESLWGGTK